MGIVHSLICVLCGTSYEEESNRFVCAKCGNLATLRVVYDYEKITSEMTRDILAGRPFVDHWRYHPLLPLTDSKAAMPLRIGGTPLQKVPSLRHILGMDHLWAKDDTSNPSGSLKDRASAVVILKGLEMGFSEIATASTGNAAASLACLAASLGVPAHIFLPETAPKAKLAQLLVFGADVIRIQGDYDEAFDLCVEACKRFGWYNRNTGYNPYTVEGKKTVAMEIVEQLGWEPPDIVIVPVGDGCILSGVWKGFVDLHRLGLIERLPRLVAAQADGSQAIKLAFDNGGGIEATSPNTLADSISVSVPRNGAMAVQDLRASNGIAVAVSDDEILEAMRLMSRTTGIFAEPAGIISLAALLRLREESWVSSNDRVVVLITGTGLKDVESALKAVEIPDPIPPSIEAIG